MSNERVYIYIYIFIQSYTFIISIILVEILLIVLHQIVCQKRILKFITKSIF